ncbi:hypothetical protein [Mycolicibacterium gilvum]|uniref:Uncharacterized protein n=1 Tax=Mycolicibacterium gilvum TaxID=1804 RepID=A0A378SE37_9MYCO|nr:hypothetical protein [Mycolicibacterium gilvum]MCV7055997.1 hypothetical protein [Mycolicibacterium gilvum]STZ41013.1 Uncharacterised protein [Mycolicibacterium gilvum]
MPIFTEVLAQFVADRPALAAVDARLRAPLSVTVQGRAGVGCRTVTGALAAAGVRIAPPSTAADVHVVAVAETLKPEDRRLLRASRPVVVVLTKADLAGRVHGGPLAHAERTATELTASTGVPVVPMVALLAGVEIDDDLFEALRTLTTAPADMTSVDAFLAGDHAVPASVRRALVARLDRFGIAHAVLAVAGGASRAEVASSLHALSGAERVLDVLAGTAAEVGYRRVRSALDELAHLAVETGDDGLWSFLTGDAVVIAVMAAAVDLMQAAGLRVDPRDDAEAHLRRALRWRRYAHTPMNALHQQCAADIARGSLRLLGRSR